MRTIPAAAGVILLTGCTSAELIRLPWQPDSAAVLLQPDDPQTLPARGPVAVDVQTFAGDVVIRTDERLLDASVTIVREASHGFLRLDEADEALSRVEYTANLVPGAAGQVLEVRAWTGAAEPHFMRAHVQIDLPAADGIRVRTQRGNVFATGVRGSVDIQTTRGDVRVMTNLPMRSAVTIVNREGDIDYRVRAESMGAFECQAEGGAVVHRVRYGRLVIHSGTDQDTLLATLNDGVNPILLQTTEGDVRVAVVHNPTDVGTLVFEP